MILRSGLPEDAVTGSARVTLFGTGAVLVEGQRGVVEMGDEQIRLKTGDGVLSIRGEGMTLKELSIDAAMVYGVSIHMVAYGAG